MKKKYLVIISSVLIVGCIATAKTAYTNNSTDNGNTAENLSFDFINQKSNLKDVVSSSKLIVKGKVTKITPIEIREIIFTDYEIDVDEVLKGEQQHVVVRLTGGTLNGAKQVSDEIKPLEKNQEYLFCLEKAFPDDSDSDVFSPIGAYQGIFAVEKTNLLVSNKSKAKANTILKSTIGDKVLLKSSNNDGTGNNNKVKIKKFNPSNAVENTILGKDIDITKYIN